VDERPRPGRPYPAAHQFILKGWAPAMISVDGQEPVTGTEFAGMTEEG
jgi:hypothetical protein